MRFVDDHDVPAARVHGRQHLRALDVVERGDGDGDRGPGIHAEGRQRGASLRLPDVDDFGIKEKSAGQFLLPLLAKACGSEDEHLVRRASRPELRDDEGGLDRLPQSDLVGNQDA
jgi:hypothetical protein